jgi:ferredoxin
VTFVIVEPCIGSKDASCVEVCPVDCIHPTKDEEGFAEAEHLFIDPGECIDCNACAQICPVDACLAEEEVPEKWSGFIAANRDHFGG